MTDGEARDRSTGEVAAALAELWAEQRGTAFERVAVLEDAAAALAGGELGDDQRAAARAAAHKLRGSAGTYGFHHASELAAELEDALAAGPIEIERTPQIASTVLALRRELEGEPAAPGAGPERASREPALLIATDDREFGESLEAAARARSRPARAVSPGQAVEAVRRGTPALVLLDAPHAASPEAALGLLSELRERDRDLPVVVVAPAGDELLDRVEAVRRGARGFIDRALDPADLVATAEHFADLGRSGAKVIAVDDDPAVLAALRALLEPRGFSYVPVADPTAFWDRLEESDPDLAVIDLDMPRIDGLDLCRAVRSDPAWAHLPLLILTAYRDPEFVRGAFAAGADDFVSKPIVEDELLARIRNRLDRVRASQESTSRDPLTGLPTRQRALAQVSELLAGNRLAGAAIVLIAVRGLEQLNERAGQRAGDDRLRELATRLAAGFPPPVGRYRGATFIALLPQAPDDAEVAVGAQLEAASDSGTGLELVAAIAPATPGSLGAALGAAERALRRREGPRVRVVGAADASAIDIAVVEDDDSVAGVLGLALDTLGLSSRRFTEGPAAVKALAGAEPELSPRVILLDWDLPGLDGLSILRRLASDGRLERSRVIMLTARAGEQETVKALELGAFDYVVKPFSVRVLVERLRRALDG